MAHKRIFLIRHGQTRGNEEKRYIGKRTDESLSEKGIIEAEKVRDSLLRLMDGRPDRLLVSPMKRALETAAILFDGPSPVVVHELTEMDFGIFEGKDYAQLSENEYYQNWVACKGDCEIPGGESKQDFVNRSYLSFLQSLGDPETNEAIAIVCHGGNVMAILSSLTGNDYYDFMVKPLDGYCLDLEMNDEGILDFTYRSLDLWDLS